MSQYPHVPPDLAALLADHPELLARVDAQIAEQTKVHNDELKQFIAMTPSERVQWTLRHIMRNPVSGIAIDCNTGPAVEIDDDEMVCSPWNWRVGNGPD